MEFNRDIINKFDKAFTALGPVDPEAKKLLTTDCRYKTYGLQEVSLNDLGVMQNKLTQGGTDSAISAFYKKVDAILPKFTEEVNGIIDIYKQAGIIRSNNSIPSDYYSFTAYGNAQQAMPTTVMMKVIVPFELDLKYFHNLTGVTEKDVTTYFNNIKTYWTAITAKDIPTATQLANVCNDTADVLCNKAIKGVGLIGGKTLTKTTSFIMPSPINKDCEKLWNWARDPYIAWFLKFQFMRISNGYVNWIFEPNLTSWSSNSDIRASTCKYYVGIGLGYRVNKKLFSMSFERNGEVY